MDSIDDFFDFSKPFRRFLWKKDGTIIDFDTKEILKDAKGVWLVKEAEAEFYKDKKKLKKK